MSFPGDGAGARGPAAAEARAKGRSRSGAAEGEPTVLLVGADKSFHSAIAGALARYGVYVEEMPAHGVVDAVVAVAPDLVLLVGDAAAMTVLHVDHRREAYR